MNYNDSQQFQVHKINVCFYSIRFEGYARLLLQIMCNSNYPNHIRNASSVALKNFVRANWAGEGEAPLADDEREELRNTLLEIMFQV
jgi:hypothetical protein